ncbi:putative copper-activated transcription factor GRISEA [Aspergillus puulaauensis]|uniref:Copper-fist domain-containing protein n=1 Tax=Aspergillus puulaauensis TaxID=1220207 RepID=A0A7R7XD84_9EURO|nr:uncharacterized protein APUU_11367A [Aspergillus puulaauensis]BCS18539.1 hypothetical protein APUU_11367A [Aspergillus puulaauensis]
MPFDENGVKWSCEPCIRGHRSSKCAHYDRLMVSVGKAGRPLSKCPHVEGSCNCKKLGAFMVAIPKGSGCLCRPVYKMLLDENKPTPAVSQLPIDLTAAPSGSSASPSPNKIQKSSKKQVKPAPEQVTRALHSIPEFHQQGLQYGTQPIMSPYTPQAPGAAYSYNALNGAFPHPNAFPTANNFSNGLGISSNGLTSNTFHTDVFQSPMEPKAPMSTRAGGSCCSNSRGENPNVVKTEPNTVMSNGYTMSPLTSYPVQNAPPSTWQGFPSVDGHFSPVGATTNGFQPDMSGFAHHISPKNYANPPDVGFEQLTMPHSGSVTTPDPAQHNSALEARDTSSSCNCGPNCNCFACPDHPYNDVTVQHVQEMGRIIAEDSGTPADESSHQETQSNGIPANDPQMGHPLAESENNIKDSVESAPAPAGQCCGTNGSTLDDDHEAQALESFTADHLMIPDAYYTYEYEIGLPGACAGEAGNCQCGPSCSCLGCLTHGNP